MRPRQNTTYATQFNTNIEQTLTNLLEWDTETVAIVFSFFFLFDGSSSTGSSTWLSNGEQIQTDDYTVLFVISNLLMCVRLHYGAVATTATSFSLYLFCFGFPLPYYCFNIIIIVVAAAVADISLVLFVLVHFYLWMRVSLFALYTLKYARVFLFTYSHWEPLSSTSFKCPTGSVSSNKKKTWKKITVKKINGNNFRQTEKKTVPYEL